MFDFLHKEVRYDYEKTNRKTTQGCGSRAIFDDVSIGKQYDNNQIFIQWINF